LHRLDLPADRGFDQSDNQFSIRLTHAPRPGKIDGFSYGPHLTGDDAMNGAPLAATDASGDRP